MNESDDASSESGGLDALLAAAKAGSTDARSELFANLQNYLAYIARQHFDPALNAKAGISDVVQDTMLHATKEFASFRGSTAEQFRGWLRQIVINEVRSMHRHFGAQQRDAGQERPMNNSPSADSVQFDFPDSALTPSREIMSNEDTQRVREILGKLPAEMRQVIQLRNWERLPFNVIAQRMGISLSQAAKLWYNALIELQRLNSELEHE